MPAKSWGELTEEERRMEVEDNTPRNLLFERMYHAVIRELIPESEINNRSVEEIFEGMDQQMVLMAIADLAAALIVDSAWPEGTSGNWPKLIEAVAYEMRCQLEGTEEVEPLPPTTGRPQ